MGSLVFVLALLLFVAAVSVAAFLKRQYRRTRVQRIRDQARLKVVENQIAGLRAALRISVAEHVVRRAIAMQGRDPFANSTDHEEYRPQ